MWILEDRSTVTVGLLRSVMWFTAAAMLQDNNDLLRIKDRPRMRPYNEIASPISPKSWAVPADLNKNNHRKKSSRQRYFLFLPHVQIWIVYFWAHGSH